MIALVIESIVPYGRLCKGLARLKGDTAANFKVFSRMEDFIMDAMGNHYSHVAYYGNRYDLAIQMKNESAHRAIGIFLENTDSGHSNYTLYQPLPQLLEKLVALATDKSTERAISKIRLCYRFIHERRQLYDLILKCHHAQKILVIDWMPVSHDDIFEGEEEGLLTYHLINNKAFNMNDFRLIRNNNITLYRPLLCFDDYSHLESVFTHKIHELCIRSNFDLCLYVEHIGFGPCFNLESQFGFEHQFILDGEKVDDSFKKSNMGESHIRVCDSWERIFACIDENS